ncbi:MAG: PAS domain S-box protein [Chloroflexota bacterium]|nr:PAS domain S-box protein [Chloroflexota bacterium]
MPGLDLERKAIIGSLSTWGWGKGTRQLGSKEKKTKRQLADEVTALRSRLAELESMTAASPRTEQRLPQTLEAISDGVAVIDLRGFCIDINASLVEMLALHSRDEALGHPVSPFIAPHDLDRARAQILRVVEEGGTVREEYDLVRADGRTIPAEIGGTLLKERSGNPASFVALVRDISKRRQAEEALRDSERLYRLLADNATDVIWTTDLNLKLTYISPSVLQLRGYTAEEAMTQTIGEIYTPASFQRARDRLREALFDDNAGQAGHAPLEVEMYRKDGSTVWAEVTVTFLRDEEGKPRGVLGITRDVSERKKVEQALQQSERLYRLLAENATDVIWTTDLSLKLNYVSPSVQRLRGYTPEEAMAQTIEQGYTPASLETARKVLAEELAREHEPGSDPRRVRTLEAEQRCKDGSTIWTEITVTFLRDEEGKPAGLLGITRDISERKKVEQALEKSESLYRLLAENATDVIWTTDLNLRSTYVSPSVQRLLGYTPEEALAWTIEVGFTPASLEAAKKVLVEELAKEHEPGNDPTRVRSLEVETSRKDGSTVWTELTVTFLRDDDGRPMGVLGITRDISERKAAEETIRHLAYHDPLTELPNRLLFNEILQLELVRASRNQQLVALIILDLDGFKTVNDVFGHSVGDGLLVKVAARLRAAVRKGDTVARMGGDEFILILPEMAAAESAAGVADKALHALRRPFTIDGRKLRITTSIGIAVYPQDGEGSNVLMKHADVAMYAAKAAGRDRFRYYEPGLEYAAQLSPEA